jgi:hypothetical protein
MITRNNSIQQQNGERGSGVIWDWIPFETPVIPAKAGIQPFCGAFPMACRVDSRLRGNDRTWERPCLANDTTTANGMSRLDGIVLIQGFGVAN